MNIHDDIFVLDQARLTAQELGGIIRGHVPPACICPMLEALVDHMAKKNLSPSERLLRTIEAGLVAGLTGQYAVDGRPDVHL